MRNGTIGVIAVLALVTGPAAVVVTAAPTATADNGEFCTTLNTDATKCEKQGNAEINDSLARSNTLPQWSSNGQQSGGPYGGAFGGGNR